MPKELSLPEIIYRTNNKNLISVTIDQTINRKLIGVDLQLESPNTDPRIH